MGWSMTATQVAHQPQLTTPPASPAELALALEAMGTTVVSPRGTVLFQQGQAPIGLCVLRKGKVRLVSIDADGQQTSRTVGAGHILGLLATVSDQPYLKTAEAVGDCEYASVDRSRVMGLLHRRTDFWLQAVDVIKDEMKLIRKRVMGGHRQPTAPEA